MLHDSKRIIIIVLLWFIIVNVFSLLALNRVNLKPDNAYVWMNDGHSMAKKSWEPNNLWMRWDFGWYLSVAEYGYSYSPLKQSNIVFFPLYPFAIRLLSKVLDGNYIFSGWLLSFLFLFLSAIYLYKITKEFHPKADPYIAVIFMLVFPTAVFYNLLYTESIFLFLSVGTFYYALRNKYPLAGIFGLLASLTRITGVLLFMPLILEYSKNSKFKKYVTRDLIFILLTPVGTFSFFLFHYYRFGDFLLFLKAEKSWGRNFHLNTEQLSLFSHAAVSNFSTDMLFIAFAIASSIIVIKKIKFSYGIYMVSVLMVALSTGTPMSIGRYILILFPMYILLASIKNKILQHALLFCSILLFALNIMLVSNGYWAG